MTEGEEVSRLLTISGINQNHVTIQLTINLKGSYSATFQLTLRVMNR